MHNSPREDGDDVATFVAYYCRAILHYVDHFDLLTDQPVMLPAVAATTAAAAASCHAWWTVWAADVKQEHTLIMDLCPGTAGQQLRQGRHAGNTASQQDFCSIYAIA